MDEGHRNRFRTSEGAPIAVYTGHENPRIRNIDRRNTSYMFTNTVHMHDGWQMHTRSLAM